MNAAKKPAEKATAPAAKTPAVRKPASKSTWTSLVTKPETAPKEVDVAPEETLSAPTTTRTQKYNVTRPVKRAVTYRLPLDVIALIEAEIFAEAEAGNRLTKDDAVTRAVRASFGKKHQARLKDLG